MIGSLVSRLDPSTDCIVWRSGDNKSRQCQSELCFIIMMIVLYKKMMLMMADDNLDLLRSALMKIRRLLSTHHHLLSRLIMMLLMMIYISIGHTHMCICLIYVFARAKKNLLKHAGENFTV